MNEKQKENEKYQEEEPERRQEEVDKNHNQKVDPKTLLAFVDELEENATSSSKLSGEKSAIYKRAEKEGIHKAALKDAVKVHNMDDGTRSSYLNARIQYDKILKNYENKQSAFDLDESLEENQDES